MKPCKPNTLSVGIGMALLLASLNVAAQQPQAGGPAASPQQDEQAQAQQQPAGQQSPVDIDAVTVTARGVEESLQEMPLPITAITSETIEEKGFQDVRDIAANSPSFSFRSAFGRDADRPVIRGMSNILGEPNASFFIDGIYVEGDISAYGLENIDQVEVIRGPQSAAFGRRTFSGAVNFITKTPGSDPGGKVTVGGGSDGQYKLGLYYSGTFGNDRFGYNASFMSRGHDGLYFNPVSGSKDLGGVASQGFMGALRWEATDSLELTARVGWQKSRDDMFAIARLGSDVVNCYLPEYTGATLGGIPIASTRRRGYLCGVAPTPDEYPINTPQYREAGWMPGSKRETLRTSLVALYHLANGWTLQSTSAYNESQKYTGYDQDYSGARGFGGAFESIIQTQNRDISQDLRITTDQSRPLYASFGGYYYRQRSGPGLVGDLTGFALTPTGPRPPVVPVATDPDNQTENKAIYGFVNWEINDQWTASLEGRYARDTISVAATDRRALAIGGVNEILSRTYALSQTFSSFTPRATLSYQWRDNINFYGLYAKGNKPGGFNLDVQRADITEAARQNLISLGFDTFKEEVAKNYEIGMKSDWLGGKLRFNTALYWIDWANQQLTANSSVQRLNNTLFSTSYITNIGESRIRGVEIESSWSFADNWRADLTYAMTDSEILSYVNQQQADLFSSAPAPTLDDPAADAAGNRLPLVPKHQASLGLTHLGQFGNGWYWSFFGGLTYESSRFAQIHNLLETGDSTRANFRVSVDPTDNLRVSAFVTNAFNDRTPEGILRYLDPTAYIAVPNVPPQTGMQVTNRIDFAVTPPQPRMWGVELSYRF